MWNLVPPPGIEPGPPALGARNLSHWATREVPHFHVLCFVLSNFFCLFVLFSWQHQCPGTDFSISAEQATPKVSDLKPQFIPLFQFCGWITAQETGKSRSKPGSVQFLARALFLAGRWFSSHRVFTRCILCSNGEFSLLFRLSLHLSHPFIKPCVPS